jgi:putative ABC transport system permease protein
MNLLANIRESLASIRANFLRAVLTLLIIAVGITCLVGILTAIDTILFSMSDSFSRMGANTFNIYPSGDRIRGNNSGRREKSGDPIDFRQAINFKDAYNFSGAKVSLNTFCTSRSTIKYKGEKTNPNIRLVGIDENYLSASAYDVDEGRNFSTTEVENGDHKIIIGSDIVKTLFDNKPKKAINEIIRVGNTRYKVIGVLASKGSSMTASNDRRVFIPLLNAKRYYGYADRNYTVTVAVNNATTIEEAIASATGSMRNVRNLKAIEENDFQIRKSDGILETLKDATVQIRLGTIAIALMTLFGAAIGLMNIMLVSVTERTREIGIRKALGATRFNIMFQFLMEAIVITILGGIVGIVLGIIVGFLVALAIKGKFIIPFQWMLLGIIVCVFVGVVSGLYPALKASRLDPIEALRHE